MAAKKHTTTTDPTTDASLLALDPSYADAPDMPIAIAAQEMASLARLAAARKADFARIGITPAKVDHLATFAKRLAAQEKAWQKSRGAVRLTTEERKLLTEAEALDSKLLAGGRWACRKDKPAQDELSRIAEGSGVADTVQDLRDLVDFWAEHKAERAHTDVTDKDLKRAAHLAGLLDDAAANEASNVDAASALELRNRCFWAGDELAKEIREGGRYAFRAEPKIAAKFVSRYRAALDRRARQKAKAKKATEAPKEKAPAQPATAEKAPPADTAKAAPKPTGNG
jgi:hypothetical protein